MKKNRVIALSLICGLTVQPISTFNIQAKEISTTSSNIKLEQIGTMFDTLEEQNEYLQQQMNELIVKYGLQNTTTASTDGFDTLYTEIEVNEFLNQFESSLIDYKNMPNYFIEISESYTSNPDGTVTYQDSLFGYMLTNSPTHQKMS